LGESYKTNTIPKSRERQRERERYIAKVREMRKRKRKREKRCRTRIEEDTTDKNKTKVKQKQSYEEVARRPRERISITQIHGGGKRKNKYYIGVMGGKQAVRKKRRETTNKSV
jgi:hypothetical protein